MLFEAIGDRGKDLKLAAGKRSGARQSAGNDDEANKYFLQTRKLDAQVLELRKTVMDRDKQIEQLKKQISKLSGDKPRRTMSFMDVLVNSHEVEQPASASTGKWADMEADDAQESYASDAGAGPDASADAGANIGTSGADAGASANAEAGANASASPNAGEGATPDDDKRPQRRSRSGGRRRGGRGRNGADASANASANAGVSDNKYCPVDPSYNTGFQCCAMYMGDDGDAYICTERRSVRHSHYCPLHAQLEAQGRNIVRATFLIPGSEYSPPNTLTLTGPYQQYQYDAYTQPQPVAVAYAIQPEPVQPAETPAVATAPALAQPAETPVV
jgi:hypothetical protein